MILLMILGGSSSAWKELCYFFTTGIVLSAFALPIVLARVSAVCYYLEYFKLCSMLPLPYHPASILGTNFLFFQIHGGACALVITGNIIMFTTIWGFFRAFDNEDGFEYSTWWFLNSKSNNHVLAILLQNAIPLSKLRWWQFIHSYRFMA